METAQLKELFKNYGLSSNQEIVSLLDRVKLVKLTHNGIGTAYGYYEMGDVLLRKIKKEQRKCAFTHDWESGQYIDDIKPYKVLIFLCESTSHMIVKPDIGEVFDQMTLVDRIECKAIDINVFDVTHVSNSHFLCSVNLLK